LGDIGFSTEDLEKAIEDASEEAAADKNALDELASKLEKEAKDVDRMMREFDESTKIRRAFPSLIFLIEKQWWNSWKQRVRFEHMM